MCATASSHRRERITPVRPVSRVVLRRRTLTKALRKHHAHFVAYKDRMKACENETVRCVVPLFHRTAVLSRSPTDDGDMTYPCRNRLFSHYCSTASRSTSR